MFSDISASPLEMQFLGTTGSVHEGEECAASPDLLCRWQILAACSPCDVSASPLDMRSLGTTGSSKALDAGIMAAATYVDSNTAGGVGGNHSTRTFELSS